PDPMPPRRTAPAAAAPASEPTGPEGRLRACAALVRTAPQQALDAANAWLAERGGLPARQCAGLAYVALEQWAAAATVYQQAAHDAETAQDASRADFWVQAGNAWLAADQPARALQALDAALATPNLTRELRGEAHLDRARVQVALGHADRARTDIDRALQLVPADPFAWYLSAALARRENNQARAATDIARASELAPDTADILLLAGTIAGQSGNMEEAERLYRRVVALAADSDAGRQAQASLATLREVEVPAPATAPAATPPPAPQPQSR
ncbi:MAG TPA: tetratricopeptide repeat protein, partial [Allosphingosinicella sp.]|nr:tetratricopeptide repeat protein [Allosphingosinicella sp.]